MSSQGLASRRLCHHHILTFIIGVVALMFLSRNLGRKNLASKQRVKLFGRSGYEPQMPTALKCPAELKSGEPFNQVRFQLISYKVCLYDTNDLSTVYFTAFYTRFIPKGRGATLVLQVLQAWLIFLCSRVFGLSMLADSLACAQELSEGAAGQSRI